MEAIEYRTMLAAEDAHWWYMGLHDLVVQTVQRETFRQGRDLDILDAGCGTGRLCKLMEPFGTVTGCDLHPLALEAASKRGVMRLRHIDLMVDDLGCNTYDLITCVDVLYHRAVSDEHAVLQNLRRALRTGGLLILHVPAFECLRGAHDVAVHTRRRYRRAEVADLLRCAGFAVERVAYRLPLLFLPLMIWRCLSRVHAKRTLSNGVPVSDSIAAVPAWMNRLLAACVKAENRCVCVGIRFPVGTSVFALARKPLSPNTPSCSAGNTPSFVSVLP